MPSVLTLRGARGSRRWLLVLLAAAIWPAQAGDSMRCRSKLVNVEMSAAEVRAKCGEPDYRDVWAYRGAAAYLADTEVWYYNFGSSQLLRLLKFRDGQLVDVGDDGYGFSSIPDGRCAPSEIVEGISKYRLLLACGEPASKRIDNLLQPAYPRYRGRGPYGGYVTPVYHELWTYNFGPRYLQRIVTLDDGFVTDVDNGERGFDSP